MYSSAAGTAASGALAFVSVMTLEYAWKEKIETVFFYQRTISYRFVFCGMTFVLFVKSGGEGHYTEDEGVAA